MDIENSFKITLLFMWIWLYPYHLSRHGSGEGTKNSRPVPTTHNTPDKHHHHGELFTPPTVWVPLSSGYTHSNARVMQARVWLRARHTVRINKSQNNIDNTASIIIGRQP
jgi:hypothetical protein